MSKAKYVDGFIIPVPKKNIARYKKMATFGAKMWMKHGALDYKECVIEDAKPKMAKTFFPQIAGAKSGDMVIFAYITLKSSKHRDQVNAKVMKDPAMNDPKNMDMVMPFDMNKMAYAGFEVLVDGQSK